MKPATPETLASALSQASSGYDGDTTLAQQAKAIYDALPTPPLAEEVRVATAFFEDEYGGSCAEDGMCTNSTCTITAARTLITALHAATEKNTELEALFDLQHARLVEAQKRWQAEDPEDRALKHPDLGSLLDWLHKEVLKARPQVRTVERRPPLTLDLGEVEATDAH